jgi:hypothetical protein
MAVGECDVVLNDKNVFHQQYERVQPMQAHHSKHPDACVVVGDMADY